MLAAVIFLQRLADAKSRLKAILSPLERAAFAQDMLLQVIDAARGASGVDEVVLVTPEPEIAAILGRRDVRLIHETQPEGLNAAALYAAAELAEAGRSRALFLPADLPRIRSADIDAVIEAQARSAADVIVPSADGSGTNALIVELPPRFPLAFGPDSFNRHLANAALWNRRLVVHRCANIGVDIDRPEDLRHLTCGTVTC